MRQGFKVLGRPVDKIRAPHVRPRFFDHFVRACHGSPDFEQAIPRLSTRIFRPGSLAVAVDRDTVTVAYTTSVGDVSV